MQQKRLLQELCKSQWLLVLLFLWLPMLGAHAQITTTTSGSAASVTSDKDDYAPRSNAVFTGAGFQPGEAVVLKVKNLNRPCNTVSADSSYLPWTVTANASGGFVTNWTVCDCFGDSLRLRATGGISGKIAYAYFTDGGIQFKASGLPNNTTVNISEINYTTGNGSNAVTLKEVNKTFIAPTGNYNITNANSNTLVTFNYQRSITVNGNIYSLSNSGVSAFSTKNGINSIVTVTYNASNLWQFSANNDDITVTANYQLAQSSTSIVVSPSTGNYGGTTSLTATLTSGSTGLSGKSISFTLNGNTVGTATTNSNGVATLNNVSISGINASATAYSNYIRASFAGDANYQNSIGSNSLTVTKKTASVTPLANSKTYGGSDPALTGNLSGFLAGDNVTAAYARVAGETVAGGPYAISATLSPAAVLGNYDITYNTANFTIDQKAASVTPAVAGKVYGSADPALTGSTNGFLAGDNVTAAYARVAGETVAGGPYAISATLSPAAVLGNYDITYNTANFTIDQKAASVTPLANSKTYGGSDPALTGSTNGFLAGDNVTAAYARVAGETVAGGPYAISATLSPAAVLGNYDITYNTANFTIDQKAASVTPAVAGKVYGSADPALTGSTNGFLAGDNVTAAYARVAGETVAGGPYAISATLSPAAVLGNYDITYNTANFTIDQKAASVTPAVAGKVYGSADPALTGSTNGFLAGDNVTAAYARVAGETVAGGPYAISATLSPAAVLGNYDITYNTANFTIDQKAASVTPAVAGKVYGSADPALTGSTNGFLAGDNVTAAYARVAGETVAGGPYAISATLSPAAVLGNYDITYNTANFTIDQKAASVTPLANSKTYGGSDPALTGSTNGFLAGDNVTAAYARVAGETVAGGPYAISATLSPAAVLGNYDITYNTANFTIDQKAASVTPAVAGKVYGSADPALTGSTNGFLAGDNVTAAYARVAGETVAGGPYAISATLSPAAVLGNYDITYNTANFTIDQKAASVTPAVAGKVYGSADPALTGSTNGFLAGDNVTAAYARVAGETVAGGPYAISATLSPAAVLGNYDITYNTANFTIDQKAASVTPAVAGKVYGSADPALTGSTNGFLAGDNVTAAYARVAGETVAGGPYAISATLSPAAVLGNYDITYNTANFTIDQKAASVTPAVAGKVYGSADPALTGSTNGFLAGDNVTAAYARVAGETVAGGPYAISATLSPAAVLGNYDITYNTANFTIDQKAASVTPLANSKTYGGSDPALTGSTNGFLAGDNVTAAYARVAGETVAGGPYAISATLSPAAVLGNYDITYNTANFTIDQKAASVTPAVAGKVYGSADPALTGSTNGFLAGDNVTAAYARVAGETVAGGPYAISATLSPAAVLGNYDITYNTANFTIDQKAASVTPAVAGKVYGSADPALTGSTNGFLAGDNVTAAYARVAGETVAGGPYAISATLSPAAVLGNYDITYNTANFTIDQKAASVTPAVAGKVYGSADPALTGSTNGFLAGDNVTAAYARVAGETVAGGPYAISATLSPAAVLGNYDITYNTANFTIDQKAASVTPAVAGKVYGSADPALTGSTNGFLAGDNVTAAYARVAGETVAGGPYAISATLSPAAVLGNYDITYNTANFTIDQKAASVTPLANSKTYGGSDPALTGSTNGFLAGDNVTAAYARVAGETVAGGPYAISATLSPAAVLGNYDITYNTANFTIDQKAASVTPLANSKTYGGSDPALTGSTNGFLAGDNVTAAYARVAGETVAGGPYAISATLSPAAVLGNYDITYNTANFTIDQKAASVTPAVAGKVYGSADPALTGSTNGFLAGDNVTAAYARVAGETVAGGPYAISATLSPAAVLGNYDITYNTANFTIDQKAASVTPAVAGKVYGSADPALTGSTNGFLAGDNVTAAYARVAGETVAGGPYAISATLSPAAVLGNYDITYNTANFTIDQKAASVTPLANSKTYGGSDPALTGSTNGFLAGDNVTAAYARVAGETVAGGPYAISATLSPAAVLGNYDITYNTANFTIDQKAASVTPAVAGKVYGSADPALTGSTNGFLAGDNVTAAYARVAGETVAGGPYAISATLSPAAVLGNYNITYNTANFTISKAVSITTIAISGAPFTYTGSPITPAAVNVTGAGGVVLSNPAAVYVDNINAGNANASYTYAGDANHTGSSATENFTIGKAQLTITAPSLSKYCGQANPSGFYCSVTGAVNNEVIATTYSYNGNTIIPASIDPKLSNYNVNFVNGTLLVNSVTVDGTDANTPRSISQVVRINIPVKYGTSTVSGVPVDLYLDDVHKGQVYSVNGIATFDLGAMGVKVYKVRTVVGTSGNPCDEQIAYLPVYDPDGGFVTGGGWINSPAGSMVSNPTATGKANFGFVAKYKKGSNVVEGNTEFQFNTGNLNFKSTSHNNMSLVISGSKATYKGRGTINGTGDYNFTLIATDGQINGGGGYDKFRIKISDGGTVIYDNQINALETDILTTSLGGGSIVIHEPVKGGNGGGKRVASENSNQPATSQFGSYPNPFSNEASFRFALETEQQYELAVHDTRGMLIKRIGGGTAEAGKLYEMKLDGRYLAPGVYFARLITKDGVKTVRVVKQ